MASIDVVAHAPVNSKESTGGRLFSKLTKSPTSNRTHRATSSVNSSGSDTVSDQLPSIPSSSHSSNHRTQFRPELPRNTSAPVKPPTLNLSRDAQPARTYSDGSGQNAAQANLKLSDTQLVPLRPLGSSSGKTSTPNGQSDGITPQIPTILQGTNLLYQQFFDMANKRMATLTYLRKAHEGKMFWFNTVQFTKLDVSRLPSYTPNRLNRRAMSFLLLGMSIPAVLEVHPQPHPSHSSTTNAALAQEYLKSLNILFTEFESYQQLHPADGSHVSSLTRARIPQMFRRAAVPGRPRKSSGAPSSDMSNASQISPPAIPEMSHHSSHPSIDTSSTSYISGSTASTLVGASPASGMPPASFSTSSSFPPPGPADAPNSTLLPNEGPYTHLLTPPLPFTPDFYSVFATLCDVLIDVYQRLLQIVNQPTTYTPLVGEAFSKTDARIRKVMVAGVVRDFEGVARETAKKELLGVQKVVLAGLAGGS